VKGLDRDFAPAGSALDLHNRVERDEPGDLIIALRLPGEAGMFSAHSRYLKVRERCDRRGASVRRLAATSECRDGRRQSASTDTMRVFLRRRQRLQ
jgi:hypothetical protein